MAMKYQIVCLRDIKANVWGIPNFVPSIGAYMRQLGDEVNTPREGNILNKHPADFEAWWLGEFDDETGAFYTEADGRTVDRRQLCHLANLVVTNPNDPHYLARQQFGVLPKELNAQLSNHGG